MSLSWIKVSDLVKASTARPTTFRIDDSIFFESDGKRFVAWIPQSKKVTSNSVTAARPASVIPSGSLASFTAEELAKFVKHWGDNDDVFAEDFLDSIIFQDKACESIKSSSITQDLTDLFRSWGTTRIAYSPENVKLSGGPNMVIHEELVPARRLFDDDYGTLVCSTRQKSSSEMELLNDGAHGPSCCSVAVPSRFANGSAKKQSLSDFRVVVKDVIDIAGLPTSNCCWSYMKLHPKAKSSAPLVQKLLDVKAPILGKTKLSPFLTREEASEAVDFQTAWNPRADGYQSTGGSSSGSAAAAAAYAWLDVAIGSDTNGSVRRPAQCCGVFGIRPSRGIFSHEGLFTVFKHFDVPGFFARDLHTLNTFSSLIYPSNFTKENGQDLPLAIIVPTDFDSDGATSYQRKAQEELVADLENYANVQAERISIHETWNMKPPKEANGMKFHEYLQELGETTFLYANYWESGKLFLEDFHKTFDEKPFVTRFVQWRWDQGIAVAHDEFEEGMRRLDVYTNWFFDEIMRRNKRFALVVTPSEDVKPLYRDDPPPQYYVQPAWHQWWLASITGSPEFVMPIGQIPYESRITGKEEVQPCHIDVMAAPGMDIKLLNYMEQFFGDVGRPVRVNNGREMFARPDKHSSRI